MSGNTSALFLNILIISAIFVLNYFYQKNNFVFSLKCICSAAFASLGIINLLFAIEAKKEKLIKLIDKTEKQARKELQAKKKYELYRELKEYKRELEDI